MDVPAAFALLGIAPDSSPDAVKDAYRDLVKVWHPDRFPGDARLQAKATERLRELNDAYRVASAHAAVSDGVRPRSASGRQTPGAPPAAVPRPAGPPSGADVDAWPWPFRGGLPFDTIWRAVFWAGVCGVLAFVLNAPEGFFALGRGRGVPRAERPLTAGAVAYAPLAESPTGEATLISRVRGTWVVAEHDEATWLPAGTRLDVQRGTLTCAPPAACDAVVRPEGAARLTLRGATPDDARDVEVLFASPTEMLWLVRPAERRNAPPSRVVLQSQGEAPAVAVAP